VACDRITLRTTLRDTRNSRQIVLIGLFWAKYARRIFAIVSTTSIPDLAPVSPTEATVDPPSRGSRLDADHPENGVLIPCRFTSTAMVNHYYIYAVDRDFGPFFLKFCSYFPFNAKLCLNGHEYAKRQLAPKGIAFEELDNGVLSCADPDKLQQQICDGL